MKTIMLRLTPELATSVLPVWERKRDQLAGQLKELNAAIRRVTSAVKTSTDSGPVQLDIQGVVAPPKTTHGRVKRGASKKLIAQFLKARNGNGATIKEITADTGTVYGTARRVLKDLQEEKTATVEKGLWKWNG
jgi:hypothetical protein